MQNSVRGLALILAGGLVAVSCGGGGGGGSGTGGSGPGTGGGSGSAGAPGGGHGGTTGAGGAAGSASGGATGAGGVAGSAAGGTTGSGGGGVTGGGGGGTTGGSGATGGSSATGGGGGATAGAGGHGGSGGAGGAAGHGGGGAGGGTAGGGGRGGAGGAAGAGGRGGAGGGAGATSCAGHAVSLSANGTGSAADTAFAHVEIDLGSDLPIANAQRTIEFWAYIKTTDWMGEKNEVYYYGGGSNTSGFGLDFGTNPVMGMSNNHATLNPVTGGGFNDDSTNDLGINSSSDQWVHIAMVWNATNLITYVNGVARITTAGSGVTALATTSSVFDLGCNPTNNSCFNGLFDELRIWKLARTATEIHDNYNKPVATDSPGLVGYWKFDESSGTTTADAVTFSPHTAHNGTLKANTSGVPTFVVPPTPLPLVCP